MSSQNQNIQDALQKFLKRMGEIQKLQENLLLDIKAILPAKKKVIHKKKVVSKK